LSRYSASVLGSIRRDAGGTVSRRRRITVLIRSTISCAGSLSASFSPIDLASAGDKVSSRYASKVRKVSRIWMFPGAKFGHQLQLVGNGPEFRSTKSKKY